MEENESFIDCINREIFEETGIELNLKSIEPFFVIKHFNRNYYSTGKTRLSGLYYFVVYSNEKINYDKINYTENEKSGNFKLEYISLDNVEQKLIDNIPNNDKNKIIAKEMIEVLKEYKSSYILKSYNFTIIGGMYMEKLNVIHHNKLIKTIRQDQNKNGIVNEDYFTSSERAIVYEIMQDFFNDKVINQICIMLVSKINNLSGLMFIDTYDLLTDDELSELHNLYTFKKLNVKCEDGSVLNTEVFNKRFINNIRRGNYKRPKLNRSFNN